MHNSTLSILTTDRLSLVPLVAAHASKMYPILADPGLYTFTGGIAPASPEALRETYQFLQERRSPDGTENWLNWIIFVDEQTPIGFVQATVYSEIVNLAWSIGVDWQGQGYATEAARAMVTWLKMAYSKPMMACINPDHQASQAVAKKIGLSLTKQVISNEQVWLAEV